MSDNGVIIINAENLLLTDEVLGLLSINWEQLKEKINVGSQVDQIKVGPREDLLLLTSKQNKTVQILTLDFITPVNVAGSPFKGPADAPVMIAVFNDFE